MVYGAVAKLTAWYRAVAVLSRYDLKINNNHAEDRAELRRLSRRLVTLCIQTLSVRRITDSPYTHGGNGYIKLVKAKEGKRRQKVGYFPSACLARASLVYHDIRRIYGIRNIIQLTS